MPNKYYVEERLKIPQKHKIPSQWVKHHSYYKIDTTNIPIIMQNSFKYNLPHGFLFILFFLSFSIFS